LIASLKRSFFPKLLILALLGLVAYMTMYDDGRKERQSSAAKRLRSAPDISLEGIRHTFVENGEKKWSLKADSARLSRSSRQTQVTDIDLTFFAAGGKSFRVTADNGLLSLDSSDAEITGNVVVHIPDGKIYTQSLRYQAQDHIITTDKQVKVEGDSLHLTGDRLRYDLRSMTAELAGDVNGIINGHLTRQ
jgi:LPS export ABC transporter protein LptC